MPRGLEGRLGSRLGQSGKEREAILGHVPLPRPVHCPRGRRPPSPFPPLPSLPSGAPLFLVPLVFARATPLPLARVCIAGIISNNNNTSLCSLCSLLLYCISSIHACLRVFRSIVAAVCRLSSVCCIVPREGYCRYLLVGWWCVSRLESRTCIYGTCVVCSSPMSSLVG